jgi:hypothetical protein
MIKKDDSGNKYLAWCDEKRAMEINPSLLNYNDVTEPYLPWCNFRFHLGIIKDENICRIRECEHYHKLYINKDSQYIHQKK